MSIRDESGKLSITPGDHKADEWLITDKENQTIAYASLGYSDIRDTDLLANIKLYAQAGTIANRYDATPSEMVETIRELRKALDVAGRHVAGLWVEESINNAMDKTAKYEEAE